jgi:hypothetical protein
MGWNVDGKVEMGNKNSMRVVPLTLFFGTFVPVHSLLAPVSVCLVACHRRFKQDNKPRMLD